MVARLLCENCGTAYRPRSGYEARCPRCQTRVNPEQINFAGVVALILVVVAFIAMIMGGISPAQFMHGMHAK